MINDLDQAVAKRNSSDEILLTRRAALLGMSFTVASASVSEARSAPPATREEMEDYFLFLWSEHQRVADELGIDVHDTKTFRERGGYARYERECPEAASSRALRVLSQAGMKGGGA